MYYTHISFVILYDIVLLDDYEKQKLLETIVWFGFFV